MAKAIRGYDNYTDDAAVQRSRDFTFAQSMVASGEFLPEHVPIPPNADDRMCGKRQWERSMQQWRWLLKSVLQQSTQG